MVSNLHPAPRSAEWLEARRTGVGGTDAAALLNLDPYKQPYDVAREKLGLAPPREVTDAMRLGIKLEPVVDSEYCERTGHTTECPPSMLRHPDHDWMFANVDRFVVSAKKRSLECKTAGLNLAKDWGEEGSDWVPENYLIQTQHQMAVTGHESTDVAVLIAGRELRIYTVERDDKLIKHLIDIEGEFWERLQNGVMPDIDFRHENAMQLIHDTFGYRPDEVTEMPAYAVEAWAKYRSCTDAIANLKTDADEAKAKVMYAMQGYAIAKFPRGTRQIKRVHVPDSIWTEEDVRKAQQHIGRVKRRGHYRLYESEVK